MVQRTREIEDESMRLFSRLLAGFLCFLAIDAGSAFSQGIKSASQRQSRTREIVVAFNKSKHVVKERRGIRREKYKEIRSEAAARANPATYSGTYAVEDLGFTLNLRVDANGRVEGSGEEPFGDDAAAVIRKFTLRNAEVDGALLTGTKVYASGNSEPFEGVFINRTSSESPTDRGVTMFGLGVLGTPVQMHGVTMNKFFYELKR
jgi:hypothetical protein